MEAIFMAEKSFSPKQLKNIPKRNIGANFFSKPNENLAPINTINGSGRLLFAPPPQSLSFSYPPSASHLNQSFYPNHPQMQQQPPLLPLPSPIMNKPLHSSLPSRTQSLSSTSSPNRKSNRTRDQSLTPKRSKSKQFFTGAKVEDPPRKDHLKPTEATGTQAVSKSSVNSIGPDPNDLPKVLGSSYMTTGNVATTTEEFSGSVFSTLSPPPSSLPLPKFSLRPKLSCNAEAAGVDVGATDNLRRLLRLR